MKSWDVFISHAAEDKETVAWPLAQALIRGGLRVWIDRQELNIGDSLREKIDAGLANSRFGVVILSPKFLAKAWPGRELNALLAIEEAGTKVILPVWHEIDKRTLAAHSPILADRLAGNTAAGIKELARNIIRIVEQDAAFTFPLSSRFNNFLSEDPSPALVHSFLASHPDLLSRAVDVNPSLHTNLIDSPRIGGVEADFCVSAEVAYYRAYRVSFVILDATKGLVLHEGKLPASVSDGVERLRKLNGLVLAQSENVMRNLMEQSSLRSWGNPGAELIWTGGFVVCDRRDALSPELCQALLHYHKNLPGIEIRTYDWLIDAALDMEHRFSASI